MKILNTFIIIIGIVLLVVRTRFSLASDELSNYGSQITFFDLFFFKWGLFMLFLTTNFLLAINILHKIIKEGECIKNEKYTRWMLIIGSFITSFSVFFLYSENTDAILKSGWIGLFDFPFFWSNIFLLLFWISMPGLKKIIDANENSTSQKESTK